MRAIRTAVVAPGTGRLNDFLDENLSELHEGDIVVITSKVIALLENRVRDANSISRDELVREEADYVLPDQYKNGYIPLTIKDNTLVPAAGIDKSNSDGKYVMWPADSQRSANKIRAHLKERFDLTKVGVIVTDSSALPLRFGTLGIPLAFSGISPFKDYRDEKDLFGHELKAGKANIAGALAAAAVAVMGEGAEQTPLAVISDAGFVVFNDHDPTSTELTEYFVAPQNDRLFEAFFKHIPWQKTK